MRRVPLERVENLVEASVFHPSPCKRLKERVLHDAAQATWRQKISRRMMVAAGAAVLILGLGISVVRIARAPSDLAMPASAPAVETQTVERPVQTSSAGSLGEGLYQSGSADGQAPASANP
jgi:hypothetical protein